MQGLSAHLATFLVVALAASIPKCSQKKPADDAPVEPIAPLLGPAPVSPVFDNPAPPSPPPIAPATPTAGSLTKSATDPFYQDSGSPAGANGTVPAPPKMTYVALQRSACLGNCPAYVVSAGTDGSAHYDGQTFVKTKGAKTWKVPAAKVEALATAFEKAGFFTANYQKVGPTDHAHVTIQVIHNGKVRTFVDNTGAEGVGLPELRKLEDEVDKRLGTAPHVQCGKGGCK